VRCKKIREQIVFYLYGELSLKEKKELEFHIENCRECAQELILTKRMFRMLEGAREESIPEADWEKCWGAIDAGITRKRTGHIRNRILAFPGWVYAGASLVLIFILGIAIGRFWLPLGPQTVAAAGSQQTTVSPAYIRQSLKDHFANIKPLIVEYANFDAQGNGREPVALERGAMESLLIQNYLLKKIVAESDPSAQRILEDLDLVLREIKNRRSDDASSPSLIKNLIQERDILFNMDVIKTM